MTKSKVIVSTLAALAASAVVAKAIARRRNRVSAKVEGEIKVPGRNGHAKVRARRSSRVAHSRS